jgi:hypothetical protein
LWYATKRVKTSDMCVRSTENTGATSVKRNSSSPDPGDSDTSHVHYRSITYAVFLCKSLHPRENTPVFGVDATWEREMLGT